MVCLRDCKIRITEPAQVATVLQGVLAQEDQIDRDKEHFYAVHLDTRNRVTAVEVVAIGTLNASLVHPRETFRRAIQEGAASLIIAHNHPSGDTEPSAEDLTSSRRLVEAGRILDIAVLDHLIFTPDGYTSLKEAGLLVGGSGVAGLIAGPSRIAVGSPEADTSRVTRATRRTSP